MSTVDLTKLSKAELIKLAQEGQAAKSQLASGKLKVTFRGASGDYSPTVGITIPGRREKRFGRVALRLAEVGLATREVQAWLAQDDGTATPFVVPSETKVEEKEG